MPLRNSASTSSSDLLAFLSIKGARAPARHRSKPSAGIKFNHYNSRKRQLVVRILVDRPQLQRLRAKGDMREACKHLQLLLIEIEELIRQHGCDGLPRFKDKEERLIG